VQSPTLALRYAQSIAFLGHFLPARDVLVYPVVELRHTRNRQGE
jgi:hypothetical protein